MTLPAPARLLLVLLATAVSGAETANDTAPITQGLRLFAVHHSFHAPPFYDILGEITRAAGIAGSTMSGDFYIGGSTVTAHWGGDGGKAARTAMDAHSVDLLITTPIYLPDPGIESFARYGAEHEPAFRMAVMEFWLPFDNYELGNYLGGAKHVNPPATVDHNAATGEMLQRIHARYFAEMDAQISDLNAKLGRQVILAVPVGQAVIALRERILAGKVPGLKEQAQLFTDSLGHPATPLRVLMAYCHLAVIYRRSPVALPVPQALTGPDAPALAKVLQELA